MKTAEKKFVLFVKFCRFILSPSLSKTYTVENASDSPRKIPLIYCTILSGLVAKNTKKAGGLCGAFV